MNVTIKIKITKHMLIWSAYQKITIGEKPSKTNVLRYLKEQIALYGSDMDSLAGERYEPDPLNPSADELTAELFVFNNWPEME